MQSYGNKKRHRRRDGSRTYNAKGYVLVRAPNHPHARNGGFVLEHRLVMEYDLGRYLEPDEVVHHINEIVDDNRRENLRLYPSIVEHLAFHKEEA